MGNSWEWKAKDGAAQNMLYMPGNWGDLLKGAWCVALARWWRETFSEKGFSYLDLFAGAPSYTLPRPTRMRFGRLSNSVLPAAAEPFLARDVWPSAASLVLAETGVGASSICVFEQDPERRAAWHEQPVTVLDLACGYDGLEGTLPGESGFVLIDPYDWMADWRAQLPRVLDTMKTTTVLLYLYNRSGRGREFLREYRAFRNALVDTGAGEGALLGRVAADAFLPSSHHEMLLLPSPHLSEHPKRSSLYQCLDAETHALNTLLYDESIIEYM